MLNSLVSQRLVKVFGQAHSQVFAIDMEHPLSQGLLALFSCEQSRWDGLLQTLRDILQAMDVVEAAWYYGSVARGEDEPRSDLDIAIVAGKGEADSVAEAVRQAVLKVEDDYFLNCSVIALSQTDVIRLSKGDEWWNSMANTARTLKGVAPVPYAKKLLQPSMKR